MKALRAILIVISSVIISCSHSHHILIKTQTVRPLKNAHSHNDYDRKNPLTDALKFGFMSIEADIHLKNNTLCVSHDKEDVDVNKTLESMYLIPLYNIWRENGKKIYTNAEEPVFLFIDIKTDSLETYIFLHKVLEKYKDMLTQFESGKIKEKAITVIVSGNRPILYMKNQQFRLAGCDGRISDLGHTTRYYYPVISDKWATYFIWQGNGRMPVVEQQKLKTFVEQAHSHNQAIRFWATDTDTLEYNHNMWNELINANVDLINTDYLSDLSKFLVKDED